MSEILSQAEIDALLAALTQEEKKDGKEPLASISHNEQDSLLYGSNKKSTVKVYDFRRPSKFSKEQLHTIQAIHENFCRLAGTYLSAYLRIATQLTVVSVEQITYEEVINSLQNPSIVSVLSSKPLNGNVLLDINPAIGFVMLDRLLGGPGESVEKARNLTDIEQVVLQKLITSLLGYYSEAWSNVFKIDFILESQESNPQFVQIVSPSEMVVLIGIEARIGQQTGMLSICIPYLTLEPIIGRLNAHIWYGTSRKETDVEYLQKLKNKLQKINVNISVRLGEGTISIKELLEVEVGDIIKLDTKSDELVRLYIGQTPKFLGLPGTIGSRLGVRIVRVIEEGEDSL
ncbi:flagellar motor switch protein FliM [Carboxydocella thermautotrophica]|nr:flagellar motor switch protein FliM [Carboxydocella thermautotrophica]